MRTVEEESLFRVAFPEVVERYLRDKALAEENKTKSETFLHVTLIDCPQRCDLVSGNLPCLIVDVNFSPTKT